MPFSPLSLAIRQPSLLIGLFAVIPLLLLACSGGGSSGTSSGGGTGTYGTSDPIADAGVAGRTWIATAPFPGTRSANASFTFGGPAGASFECDLDGAGWNSCTSPHAVNGVAVGEHTFQVRAVVGGVADARPASWQWEYTNNVHTLASFESAFYSGVTNPPLISNLGAFTTPCDALTTLELRNDQNVDRTAELAWSGVAIPRELNLTSSANLVLIGAGETLVAAQFKPLARWNAEITDTTAPIKWLEVAAITAAGPNSSANYSLRYCATPPAVTDANALQVTTNPDSTVTVDTGVSQVTFDPSSVTGISDGLVGAASMSVAMSVNGVTGQTGTPSADSAEFLVEESGPVKTVIRARGHVTGLTGPGCTDPLGYTLRWTLVRGSADIGVETDFVNECGDGMFAASPGAALNGSDLWSRTLSISDIALKFNFSGVDTASVVSRSSRDGVTVSNASSSIIAVADIGQNKGAITNAASSAWRWASEALTTTYAEFFTVPVVGVSDANLTVMGQQPWLRFREPQGMMAQSTRSANIAVVSLSPVKAAPTDPFTLGEAQGIWGQGRIAIDTSNLSDTAFVQRAQKNNAAMERGLLWHAPLWYLNQTKVFPKLPDISVSEMATLVPLIEGAHNNAVTDSILGGAQRDRMKGYSLVGWTDSMQEGIKDVVNATLNDYSPGSNIWSPTNTELLMWFISGDPKWVWDYALPAEWNLWKANAYNTGSRGVVGIRSGLVIASGSIGDGARYRSGYGSDDKFYNQGSGKAYVIRPYRSLAERFQAAGDTVISRYVDAVASREDTVSSRVMTRQVMQHLNALRYAAEFSPVNQTALRAKYDAMMQEYAADNLANGTFCYSDDGASNQNDCAFAPSGIFHYVALWQELFYDRALDLPPGDAQRETIINALASTARLIDAGIPRDSNNQITDFTPSAWGDSYVCDFSSGSDIVAQCVKHNCTGLVDPDSNGICPTDPTYDNAHLNALGTVIIGNFLDPGLVSNNRCGQARQGFETNLNSSTVANHLRDSGYGWHKDASQMVQTVLYAIAAARSPGCVY